MLYRDREPVQIAQSVTDVVTRSKPSNQSRRCVLCTLQRSDGGLRKTSKYRIALIESTQHGCRNTHDDTDTYLRPIKS